MAQPGGRVIDLGLALKANTPDIRNTRIIDVVAELRSYQLDVEIHDPLVDPSTALDEYEITLPQPKPRYDDANVVAVGHSQFRALSGESIHKLGKSNAHVIYDVAGILKSDDADLTL